MSSLVIESLSHAYGKHPVLENVSFQVEAHKLASLVGPSGSGKTTLLRLIAGLEQVQKGTIILGGTVAASYCTHTPPERRHVGMVFQEPALFPHLTVEKNIAFGLNGYSKEAQRQRVLELLSLIGLNGLETRLPHQLSGGQQQRVAIARALAPKPGLLLLDEPFVSLDVGLRRSLRREIRDILHKAGATAILVTHDAEEAIEMSDSIFLLGKDGRLHQSGTPEQIYLKPKDGFAARFFGLVTVLNGQVTGGKLETPFGLKSCAEIKDGPAVLMLRPEWITRCREGEMGLQVTVWDIQFSGASSLVLMKTAAGQEVLMSYASGMALKVGEKIMLRAQMERAVVMPQSVWEGRS